MVTWWLISVSIILSDADPEILAPFAFAGVPACSAPSWAVGIPSRARKELEQPFHCLSLRTPSPGPLPTPCPSDGEANLSKWA